MKTNHYKKTSFSRLILSSAKFVLLASFSGAFSIEAEPATEDNVTANKLVEISALDSSSSSDSDSSSWNFLKPYIANYSFFLDKDKLGQSIRTFSRDDQHWEIDTNTIAKKFIINLKSKENSKFHIKDGLLVNDQFVSYSKRTFKKVKDTKQVFDWKTKVETGHRNKKKWQLPLQSQVFDRVSHLIQLRADLLEGKAVFNYPVSHKGKIHAYIYQFDKTEIIKTKMGDLVAQKYVRTKSNGAKFVIWLSPALEYLAVKISQSKKDSPEVTLLLESIEYTERPKIVRTES